ncbi:MAG: AAA family ATPase [Planctomycetes bacterium DG_20]|nr:MAG: AAA family ATPase [Planctomycetes bacterium DG_20]
MEEAEQALSPEALRQRDLAAVHSLREAHERILGEIRKVIVGQEEVVDQLLTSLFARGHALLVGVPGLAKTLMVSTLANCLSLRFHRIQFTPDLMPADITGTEVLQDDPATGERRFKFLQGPVFANLILADEINRTPPKTQAALLEAMQEKKVSIGGEDHFLEEPFFVLATQNPIEQEGTYPLPEAQLDRFLFMTLVDYPADSEELEIMHQATGAEELAVEPVLSGEEILTLQRIVRRVPAADHVFQYAKAIVRATRPNTPEAPKFINDWVQWGAGPRASLFLILAGKARAILSGRYHVSCDDVEALAAPILRHRIICNFTARSEGIATDDVVGKLLQRTPKTEKLASAK